VRAVFAAVAGD